MRKNRPTYRPNRPHLILTSLTMTGWTMSFRFWVSTISSNFFLLLIQKIIFSILSSVDYLNSSLLQLIYNSALFFSSRRAAASRHTSCSRHYVGRTCLARGMCSVALRPLQNFTNSSKKQHTFFRSPQNECYTHNIGTLSC